MSTQLRPFIATVLSIIYWMSVLPPAIDRNVQEKKIQLFGACVLASSLSKQEWL